MNKNLLLLSVFFVLLSGCRQESNDSLSSMNLQGRNGETDEEDVVYTDDETSRRNDSIHDQEPKVALSRNELLLHASNANLDIDSFEEQILLIKVIDDPQLPIKLAVIDYDDIRGSYSRSWEHYTNATNHRIFDLELIDITGDFNTEIVLTGMNNKDVTMDVYKKFPSLSHSGLYYKPICELVSDGTITIQRKDRPATYDEKQKTGESYPIVVERRDRESQNENDFIRETYQWVYANNKYEFIPPAERIAGQIVDDKKFDQLRSSYGVEYFESYLEGPWYNSRNIDQMILFFPREEQVVFFQDNAQEVYSWDYSSRRNHPLLLTLSIRNILVHSIKKTINITARSLTLITISTNDETWSGDFYKVKEEFQESLYNDQGLKRIKPAHVELSGIFEEEYIEESSTHIIFEPPDFTWIEGSGEELADYSGGFAIMENIPVLNEFYFKRVLQSVPDSISRDTYNSLMTGISNTYDRNFFGSHYQFDGGKQKHLLIGNIKPESKTKLWDILVSVNYKGFIEYNIGVITFKILDENDLLVDVRNYILEYSLERMTSGEGHKKSIVLTKANLYMDGVEATTQEFIRLVQYIED